MTTIQFDSTLSSEQQRNVHFKIAVTLIIFIFVICFVYLDNSFDFNNKVRGLIVFLSGFSLLFSISYFLSIRNYEGVKGYITEKEIIIETADLYGLYKQAVPIGKYDIKYFTHIINYVIMSGGNLQFLPKQYIALRPAKGKEIALTVYTDFHIARNIRDRVHIITKLPVIESKLQNGMHFTAREKAIDDSTLPKDINHVLPADSLRYNMFGVLKK